MNRRKLILLASLLALIFVTIAPGPSGDVSRFFQDYTVQTKQEIRGTVFVVGGDLVIQKDATVMGDAIVLFGSLTIDGRVNGSAGSIFGDTKVTSGASIIGDCGTLYGRLEAAEGSILGETGVLEPPANFSSGNLLPVITTTVIAIAVFMYLISCLIYLIFPKRATAISQAIPNRLGRRFLIGFLVNLAILPLIVVLVITVVGIFLIPFVAIIYLAVNLLASVGLSLTVGKRISGDLKEGAVETPYICLLSGVLVVFVISIIPVLGWLIYGAASCIALGATVDTRLGEVVDSAV